MDAISLTCPDCAAHKEQMKVIALALDEQATLRRPAAVPASGAENARVKSGFQTVKQFKNVSFVRSLPPGVQENEVDAREIIKLTVTLDGI